MFGPLIAFVLGSPPTSFGLSPNELNEIRRLHTSDAVGDREKDNIELRLARRSLQRNVPFLGICASAADPRAPIHPTIKKPNGAKKTGRRAGELGVQKLTTKLCSQQLCPASIRLDRNGRKLNISVKNYEQRGYMVGSTISHALGHL